MSKKRASSPKNEPEARKNAWWKDVLSVVLMAVVLALCVKTFLVDTRMVPSGSMLPTIELKDRVILSKLSYVGPRTPQRGDIVVFKAPAEMNEKSDLLKRVIGLPGETVRIEGGVVYIDDMPLEEDYLNEKPSYTYGPVTVPEGCYFMLGDNRNASYDAHRWQEPFIPEKDIKGKAIFRYWPIDRIGDIYE